MTITGVPSTKLTNSNFILSNPDAGLKQRQAALLADWKSADDVKYVTTMGDHNIKNNNGDVIYDIKATNINFVNNNIVIPTHNLEVFNINKQPGTAQVISNFNPDSPYNIINLSKLNVASFESLGKVQNGPDVIINVGEGQSIVLPNVQSSQLKADDFAGFATNKGPEAMALRVFKVSFDENNGSINGNGVKSLPTNTASKQYTIEGFNPNAPHLLFLNYDKTHFTPQINYQNNDSIISLNNGNNVRIKDALITHQQIITPKDSSVPEKIQNAFKSYGPGLVDAGKSAEGVLRILSAESGAEIKGPLGKIMPAHALIVDFTTNLSANLIKDYNQDWSYILRKSSAQTSAQFSYTTITDSGVVIASVNAAADASLATFLLVSEASLFAPLAAPVIETVAIGAAAVVGLATGVAVYYGGDKLATQGKNYVAEITGDVFQYFNPHVKQLSKSATSLTAYGDDFSLKMSYPNNYEGDIINSLLDGNNVPNYSPIPESTSVFDRAANIIYKTQNKKLVLDTTPIPNKEFIDSLPNGDIGYSKGIIYKKIGDNIYPTDLDTENSQDFKHVYFDPNEDNTAIIAKVTPLLPEGSAKIIGANLYEKTAGALKSVASTFSNNIHLPLSIDITQFIANQYDSIITDLKNGFQGQGSNTLSALLANVILGQNPGKAVLTLADGIATTMVGKLALNVVGLNTESAGIMASNPALAGAFQSSVNNFALGLAVNLAGQAITGKLDIAQIGDNIAFFAVNYGVNAGVSAGLTSIAAHLFPEAATSLTTGASFGGILSTAAGGASTALGTALAVAGPAIVIVGTALIIAKYNKQINNAIDDISKFFQNPSKALFGTSWTNFDGTNGPDIMRSDSDKQRINLLDGDDIFFGFNAWNVAFGGNGVDILFGGNSNRPNELYGDDGDDYLRAGTGSSDLYGGAGSDYMVGGASGDAMYGKDRPNDYYNRQHPNMPDGNDIMFGNDGDDLMFGDDGNDIMEGGSGADTMDGGTGIDTLSYASSPAGVAINLSTNFVSGGDATGDKIVNFENINGSAFNDILTATVPGSIINAGAGNDIVNGGIGNDALYGNEGDDTISAGAGNDYVHGGKGNDVIYGNEGDDDLYGGLDDDYIHGGQGNDTIEGGVGRDDLDGGVGINTLSYRSSPAAVTVNLSANIALGGDAEGDKIANFQNIIGSAFDDHLTASASGSNIYGGKGSDTILGGVGNDILYGGSGLTDPEDDADIIDGGAGDDTIYGNGGDDILKGGAGNDVLYGGAGNDLFDGGTGGNSYIGGVGSDTYIITPDQNTMSTIVDFEWNNANEKIDLTNFLIKNLTLTQVGNNVVVSLPDEQKLILNDINVNTLSASNFKLFPYIDNANAQSVSTMPSILKVGESLPSSTAGSMPGSTGANVVPDIIDGSTGGAASNTTGADPDSAKGNNPDDTHNDFWTIETIAGITVGSFAALVGVGIAAYYCTNTLHSQTDAVPLDSIVTQI